MSTSNDNSILIRLRRWWASPPRPGPRRIISPWEYRHLRFSAALRIGGAVALTALGVITLGFGGGTGKLGLPPSDADHRRVLAVLRYLQP